MVTGLVPTLYKLLLHSSKQLQRDVDAGHTIKTALRSAGLGDTKHRKLVFRDKWNREKRFRDQLEDAKAWPYPGNAQDRYAMLVRTQFRRPLDSDSKEALDGRIDAAFDILRDLDDHNSSIEELKEEQVYKPQARTEDVKFSVGDIVQVENGTSGVICSWTFEDEADSDVVYTILPHSTSDQNVAMYSNVKESEMQLCQQPDSFVSHFAHIYFDEYCDGHYVPSYALASKFPDDEHSAAVLIRPVKKENKSLPSILDLQFADEDTLVSYLDSDDKTVKQLALASLEGAWMAQCGEDAQARFKVALDAMSPTLQVDSERDAEALNMFREIVNDYPDYAYAWSKIGILEFRARRYQQSLEAFRTALESKPDLLDALSGLALCALEKEENAEAYRAAYRLQQLQPDNELSEAIMEEAIACAFRLI